MTDPTAIQIDFDPMQKTMSGRTTHGNIYFEAPYISEVDDGVDLRVPFPLFQGGCSDGLILPHQIRHIVSLYPWEQYTIKRQMLSNVSVKMFDSLDQGFEQVDILARWVNLCRQTGPVLVHCQAGLNRSSLVAAKSLVLLGMEPEAAIAQIRKTRSEACLCNPAFENWLLDGGLS